MMEPLFGSTSPMWAGVVSPMFGWSAPAGPFGNRPAATSAPLNSPMQWPTFPPFAAPEMSNAPTAGALAAAVALRRGQPAGPTTDAEIEDTLYDAIEFLSGTTEVDIRSDSGRVTVTGTVPHKRQKRDVGEICWAIPAVTDVQNNLTIATRRRGRSSARETESHHQPVSTRKPA